VTVRKSELNLLDLDQGKSSPYRTGWWGQFTACLWRSSKTAIRDPLVLKVQLMQTVVSVFNSHFNLFQDFEGIKNILIAYMLYAIVHGSVYWDLIFESRIGSTRNSKYQRGYISDSCKRDVHQHFSSGKRKNLKNI